MKLHPILIVAILLRVQCCFSEIVSLRCPSSIGKKEGISNKGFAIGVDVQHLHTTVDCNKYFASIVAYVPRMCEATVVALPCLITLNNVAVSPTGGVNDVLQTVYSYDHESIGGSISSKHHFSITSYDFEVVNNWEKLAPYQMIVPLRLYYDHLFNHLSFQTLIHIAHAKEFLSATMWNKSVFHCSPLTSLILQFVYHVEEARVIVSKPIKAKAVTLPWLSHWDPYKGASLFGIAADVCLQLRQNLVSGNVVHTITPSPFFKAESTKFATASSANSIFCDVAYFSRSVAFQRRVRNEEQVLAAVRDHLRHLSSRLNSTCHLLRITTAAKQPSTREDLLASWRGMTELLQHSRVIMGAHGGALNNIIFARAEQKGGVHLIEFNDQPSSGSGKRGGGGGGGGVFRPVFAAAAWATGLAGYHAVPAFTARNISTGALSRTETDFYLASGMYVDIQTISDKLVSAFNH